MSGETRNGDARARKSMDGAPARTLGPKTLRRDMRRARRNLAEDLLRVVDDSRPQTRGDCIDGPRPCLWVSCRFHLYLDISDKNGSMKLNFPDLEIWELPESCALDLAAEGGLTLERVGSALNVTRERARQVENCGMNKLRKSISEEGEPIAAAVVVAGRRK